jgi:hypothetical protein
MLQATPSVLKLYGKAWLKWGLNAGQTSAALLPKGFGSWCWLGELGFDSSNYFVVGM